MPGVSSMNIFASLSVPSACDSRPQSLSTRNPVRSRWLSMRASDVSMRRNSCSFDISRLKMPTVRPVFVPDVLRDVQDERGLADRRPRRDDDEIARLKAGRHLVEIGEPRRHAGDELLALVRALDRGEARVRQLPHRRESGAHAIFGNREDRLLGLVENQVRLLLRLVGGREDLVRRQRSDCEASTSRARCARSTRRWWRAAGRRRAPRCRRARRLRRALPRGRALP